MLVGPETSYASDTSFVISDLFFTDGDGIGSYQPDLDNGANPSKEEFILY